MSQTPSIAEAQAQLCLQWHSYLNNNLQGQTVALSRDGKTLAVHKNGIISIWRLSTSLFTTTEAESSQVPQTLKSLGLDQRLTFLRHNSRSIAFSRDGQMIASGSKEGEVRLWRVCQNESESTDIWSGSQHSNWVCSVEFSYDGSILASGSFDSIKFWNWQKDQLIRNLTYTNSQRWIDAVTFSPDGKLLANSHQGQKADGQINLWDWKEKKQLDSIFVTEGKRILALTFNPVDQNQIACGTENGKIVLLDCQNKQPYLIQEAHSDRIYFLAFSCDGQMLISGSHDHTFKCWRLPTQPRCPSSWINKLTNDMGGDEIEGIRNLDSQNRERRRISTL